MLQVYAIGRIRDLILQRDLQDRKKKKDGRHQNNIQFIKVMTNAQSP